MCVEGRGVTRNRPTVTGSEIKSQHEAGGGEKSALELLAPVRR